MFELSQGSRSIEVTSAYLYLSQVFFCAFRAFLYTVTKICVATPASAFLWEKVGILLCNSSLLLAASASKKAAEGNRYRVVMHNCEPKQSMASESFR